MKMHMETIEEEPNDLKARLQDVRDELEREKRLRSKIERYCNENHCGHDAGAAPDVTWQMYRKREVEVAKLRTNIELAMNSHEEAMNLAKLQFTQELDQLQKEISSLKDTSPTDQAPHQGGSVSTIEENFSTRKLEIELDELRQQKHNSEYEVKRLRVRLSEETKARETFEQQLKDAMLQLDELHRELDDEQNARNGLKKSLKAAAAELEEWKSQYASGALKGPSDEEDFASRRRLSIKMQEIDEAIQKAESASVTMAKVKTQDITTRDEQEHVIVSLDKGKKGRSAGFSLEQELQEFKIKFADSEQQLCIWKKKFEELGYLKDSLEETIDVKVSQIKSWQNTCNEMKEKLKEMEIVRKEKYSLEDRISEMTAAVQRTESLERELEELRGQFADEKHQLKAEISSQEGHITTLETVRDELTINVDDLQKKISELETRISGLNAENEKLSYNLEASRSSLDLQGQGKSSLEQKVHSLNARLVEIQGKYVNEQQEKQELRRIFRESTVGVVQLKAKVECERIKNPDDYKELKETLISRLTMTEEIFTEAQARARKELVVNQKSRRASVGLLPVPPSIPDKEEYEVLEWKEKYDEICREIEKAEDEVKVMAAQVARLQCVADETGEDLHTVAEEKNQLNEKFELTTQELDSATEEISNLKEYNDGLNEEIVKYTNTIKEMETAFEEDTNSNLAELGELRAANDDLKDALEIVSKQADNAKDEIQEKSSKTKEILDELEALKLENEELHKNNRDLDWKLKNKTIALDEEAKSHKETDAELLSNEKKVKELMRALEESREKEADSEKSEELQHKIKDLKNKLKEEKELHEEAGEELGKMKKKLKDAKKELEEAVAAKEEEIDDLKKSHKDAVKQVKEIKLSLKEETASKEVAEEEAVRIEKKMQEYLLKIEGLEKPDKYGADALESNKKLNKRIKDLQAQLEEEIAAHEETEEKLVELKNKTKGIKAMEDSELEVEVKEMKAALEEERAAHRNTDEELANVRKKLKEVKKELEEEQAGATKSKAKKLQQNVEEFKSALLEEKNDHENTNDLLNMIQKELNQANKKISSLRNQVEDRQESEQDVESLQKKLKELQRVLEEEQNDHENSNNELQEAQKKLKFANRKIADLESDLEESKGGKSESKGLKSRIKELESTLAEQQEDYESTDNELSKLKKDLKEAHDRISELQEQEGNSKAGNREKKALERKIEDLEATLADEQADHETTDSKLIKAQEALKKANETIEDLEEQKSSGKANSRETKALERKIEELEATLAEEQAEHESQVSKMRKDLKAAKERINELQEGGSGDGNSGKPSRRHKKDDEGSSEEIKVLKTQVTELTTSVEDYTLESGELKSALNKAESKSKRLQSQLDELQEYQEKLEKELTETNESLETQLEVTKTAWEEEKTAVSDMQNAFNRAERRYNTAKEELDDFKSSQNLDEDDQEKEIVKLQRKIENLHVALEEEMSAHEETDSELRRLEGKLEEAHNEIQELKTEDDNNENSQKSFKSSAVVVLKKKEDPKIALATKTIQLKVQQLEKELEEERTAFDETMENYSELKKRYRSMSLELQTLRAQSSVDIEDGEKSGGNLQQQIESLEAELSEEKTAHEETFNDLKQSQKKLKTVKIQLQAARTENDQADGTGEGLSASVRSEFKIQIQNLQNALDEQIVLQEETEKKFVELKKSHKSELKVVRGHKGLPLGKVENDGTDEDQEFERQMAELQVKYDKLLAELELSRADSNKLEDELEDAHMRIQAGKKDVEDIEAAKEDIEAENKDLKDNIKDLLGEIDDLRNAEDYSSVQRRRASKSAQMEGVGKRDLVKENQHLQKTIAELEDELEEIKSRVRQRASRADDSDDEDSKNKELQSKLSEALFELEAVEEVLQSEEKFRAELKFNLKDTMKDLEKMKNEYEETTADLGLESSGKWIKSQRRFANRMSDLEDGLSESQTKIKTVDKYQVKIAEMNKEIRRYLDEAGGSHGMSAYVWKSKYDVIVIQLQRTEKELETTSVELVSLTQMNVDVTAEMQQYRQDNRQLQDRIDELLKEIAELKKDISELESTKRKMEREISEMTTAIEELQYTLDDERVRAESKIAELTQLRLELQKEIAEKDEHIERITKTYEREIKGLKEDLELERQAAIDYARHKSRMSDLLAQLQAQVEMLSESNSEFAKNNKKLQIKLKETQGFFEEEKVSHAHTCDSLARCEKRLRECFKQIDALRLNLERAERLKKRVAGEAEESQYKLDHVETRTIDLESMKLKNEIEIDNLRGEVEELEARVGIAEEKARASLAELAEVKSTLRKYMDLEGEGKKLKEQAEKELRETQIRLAGLEDVDVKQLKNQIRTLLRQNAELEEDLSSVLHQTKGFQRFEEKYERIVSNLEIDLDEWKRAAELARAENEALQMKMKKMRAQLEGAESQAMVITSKYKNAQLDVDDATERADAAVKALMVKTRGLDFAEGRTTSEHYSFKGEEVVSFENI